MALRGMSKAHMVEAYPRVVRERDRLDLMLHDMVNGAVTFGDWVPNGEGGKYHVGISRWDTYPLCIVKWRVKGQHDSVQVFDLEPYEQKMREFRCSSESYEPILRAIRSAKDAVRGTEDRVTDPYSPMCGSPSGVAA